MGKCRCYINLKYYSRVARTGQGTFRGYKPCPIHNPEECEYIKELERRENKEQTID